MRRVKFVPMTLENVGSSGKFFTDKTIMKQIGVILLAVFTFLIVSQFLNLILPLTISLILSALIAIWAAVLLSRFWVFRERQLKKLLYKITKRDRTNAGEFSDIYHVDKDNICYHESGHVSAFIRVIRGTTIGMSHANVDEYYKSFENFENTLLSSGFSYMYFDTQYSERDFEFLKVQRRNLSKTRVPRLKDNMMLRNKYLTDFTRLGGRFTYNVYVVYSTRTNIDNFRVKVSQALTNLTLSNHLVGRYIMDKKQIEEFGKVYYNVPYFELAVTSEEDNRNIINFKEEVL